MEGKKEGKGEEKREEPKSKTKGWGRVSESRTELTGRSQRY